MKLEIEIPDSISIPKPETADFYRFLQQMSNRRVQGFVRYGPTHRRKKYLSRLKREVEAYDSYAKSGGNREQLLNIAVYAFLESCAPEHPGYHFDASTDSATRKEFGI